MHRLARLTLALVAALIAEPLDAQTAQPIFVQATLGAGTSEGGRYTGRAEITKEVLMGWRLPTRKIPYTVGLAIGDPLELGDDAVCVFDGGDGCVPSMPEFTYFALLAGVEARGEAGEIGAMVGPAFVAGHVNGASQSWTSGARIGAQLRIDLASPSFFHLAFTVSPRVVWVPNVRDATLSLRSLNFGLRFQ